LRAGLAATDVERRDDDVEPLEDRVVVVEATVDRDLQLAAVQEPEPGVRAFGRRPTGDLALEPLVQLRDDTSLLLDAIRAEPVRDRQAPGGVGQDHAMLP